MSGALAQTGSCVFNRCAAIKPPALNHLGSNQRQTEFPRTFLSRSVWLLSARGNSSLAPPLNPPIRVALGHVRLVAGLVLFHLAQCFLGLHPSSLHRLLIVGFHMFVLFTEIHFAVNLTRAIIRLSDRRIYESAALLAALMSFKGILGGASGSPPPRLIKRPLSWSLMVVLSNLDSSLFVVITLAAAQEQCQCADKKQG